MNAGSTPIDTCRVAMVGAAAYALCDSLHELGHLVATLLPLGVSALSISSVGVSTAGSSPVVSLAGPLVNLVLAGSLRLAATPSLPAHCRYFAWLFGTANLFNCFAYLLYSAVLGSGDWAAVFAPFVPALWWRPVAGLAGALLYAGAIGVSLRVLRNLLSDGVVSPAQAARDSLGVYLAGGLLLTVAAALNPISPWLILTSGIATGFGAMFGFALVPTLLKSAPLEPGRANAQPLRYGNIWAMCCLLVSLGFVLILGRGLQIAPSAPRLEALRIGDTR